MASFEWITLRFVNGEINKDRSKICFKTLVNNWLASHLDCEIQK